MIVGIALLLAGCARFPVTAVDPVYPPTASRYYGSDARWHYFEKDLVRASVIPMPRSYYVRRFRVDRADLTVSPEMPKATERRQAIEGGQFVISIKKE